MQFKQKNIRIYFKPISIIFFVYNHHILISDNVFWYSEIVKMEGKNMPEEITSFLKLPVYTRNGLYVGNVKNVIIDLEKRRVSSLLLTNTNPSIVENSVDVAVPYRWVNAVGDIVILSYFPDKIKLKEEKEEIRKLFYIMKIILINGRNNINI